MKDAGIKAVNTEACYVLGSELTYGLCMSAFEGIRARE